MQDIAHSRAENIDRDSLKNVRVLFNLLDRARKAMSESERASVQNDLQSGEYVVQHTQNNVYFYDKSKLKMNAADFDKEAQNAAMLADFGFTVYLIREDHSVYGKHSIDAIIDGIRMEFKHITGKRATAGAAYRNALKQCPNVSMFFAKDVKDSMVSYINKIRGTAMATAHKKGILVMYFEKEKQLVVQDMSSV